MIETYHQPGEGIIYARGKDFNTLDDFRAWNQTVSDALVSETRHEVHLVYDARLQTGIEMNLSSAVEIFTIFEHQHLKWVLLIASDKAVETQMATLIAQLFRLNYRVMRTPHDARDFLMDIDETLVWRDILDP